MNASLEQDKLLAARVADAVYGAQNRHQSKFIGFLGEHEAAYAAQVARSLHHPAHRLFGGYEGASRVYLGVFSQFDEQDDHHFPIFPITFSYRKADKLTHRDFLGALLALGLTRDSVGDILTGDGSAVVFANEACAALCISEVAKVGSVGVNAQSGILASLDTAREFDVIEGTVASARLDSVVALVTKLSRQQSAVHIAAGLVGINGRQTDNISYKLSTGDSLSIRGYGKYIFDGVSGVSRKGRQRVIVRKYI